MSRETIEGIHKAIQAHIDESKGSGDTLTDFVVVRSTITSDGAYGTGYISSSMVSPHGTYGLLTLGQEILRADLMGES